MDVLINELKDLLDLSLKISFNLRGIVADRIQKEASGFLMKQVLHSYSMYQIINPQPMPELPSLNKGVIFHDHSTALVLSRIMLETYINMVYLLILPNDKEELDFRLDMWELHALCERRKIGDSMGFQLQELIDNESEIKKYIEKIQNSNFYKNLPRIEKQSIYDKLRENAIYYTKWSPKNNLEKAILVGLNNSVTEYLYKMTSAYVHSESFSVMQFLGLKSDDDSIKLCYVPLWYSIMFLALTINKFSELVDLKIYNIDENQVINKYIDLSTKDFKSFSN